MPNSHTERLLSHRRVVAEDLIGLAGRSCIRHSAMPLADLKFPLSKIRNPRINTKDMGAATLRNASITRNRLSYQRSREPTPRPDLKDADRLTIRQSEANCCLSVRLLYRRRCFVRDATFQVPVSMGQRATASDARQYPPHSVNPRFSFAGLIATVCYIEQMPLRLSALVYSRDELVAARPLSSWATVLSVVPGIWHRGSIARSRRAYHVIFVSIPRSRQLLSGLLVPVLFGRCYPSHAASRFALAEAWRDGRLAPPPYQFEQHRP